MPTPISKRKENELDVIRYANDIAKYVMTITRNEKIFKCEYEKLTDRLLQTALDIPMLLIEANNINVTNKDKAKRRIECQRMAKVEIKNLICIMKQCQSVFKFRSNKTEYLVRLCLKDYKLITSWNKSDSSRYKEYLK